MKLVIIVLSIAGICLGCRKQETTQKQFNKIVNTDSSTGSRVEYYIYYSKEGKEIKHGQWRLYYKEGGYVDAHYNNGVLDGDLVIYDSNNIPVLQGTYSNGIPWNGKISMGHYIQEFKDGHPLTNSITNSP